MNYITKNRIREFEETEEKEWIYVTHSKSIINKPVGFLSFRCSYSGENPSSARLQLDRWPIRYKEQIEDLMLALR